MPPHFVKKHQWIFFWVGRFQLYKMTKVVVVITFLPQFSAFKKKKKKKSLAFRTNNTRT